jgi:outer membrane protein OmpA-like peptidoglycan-associated protein
MKVLRIMLVPATVAWFAGGTWWIAGRTEYVRAAPAPVNGTPAAIIHLGPEPVATPAEPEVALPALNLVIPFAKNTGDFALSDEQAAWCRMALEHLHADPHARVLVTGHTDADGDAEVNRRLSAARARLVMEALVNAGLPAARIRAEGLGPDRPVADNRTSKGKAQNRRVEVSIGTNMNAQNP